MTENWVLVTVRVEIPHVLSPSRATPHNAYLHKATAMELVLLSVGLVVRFPPISCFCQVVCLSFRARGAFITFDKRGLNRRQVRIFLLPCKKRKTNIF